MRTKIQAIPVKDITVNHASILYLNPRIKPTKLNTAGIRTFHWFGVPSLWSMGLEYWKCPLALCRKNFLLRTYVFLFLSFSLLQWFYQKQQW